MKEKTSNIKRYSIELENKAFKSLNLNMEKYDDEIDKSIKNELGKLNKDDLKQKENYGKIIHITSELVFTSLEKEQRIAFPRIVQNIESSLPLDIKRKIQELLKQFTNPYLANEFTSYRANNYTPFLTFYKMYYNKYFRIPKKDFMKKVYYGFSFLASRNISEEEKQVLDSCYSFMSYHFPNKEFDIINLKEVPVFKDNFLISYILSIGEQTYNSDYNKATEKIIYQESYRKKALYNVLLNTTLQEMGYYCVMKLYIECNQNTMTYKELIESHLFSDKHNIFINNIEEAIYEKEEDSFRKHIKNFIFSDDAEETYYRNFRGKSKIKNKTFCLCEKDVYNIIYTLYERRSPRSGKTGSPKFEKKDLDRYYNGLYEDFLNEYKINNP